MARCTALIANHNYGQYILDAIQGIRSQTYTCNIAIGDDASIDNSIDIIRKTLGFETEIQPSNDGYDILSYENNIFIRLHKQSGPSHTRNLLIQHTLPLTDYYLIADADDIALPTKVEKMVKVLDENPLVGIVYADYNILNMDSENTLTEFKEPYSHPRLLQQCIVHSNFMVRKTALEQVMDNFGWYDFRLRCVEDWDLELRICDKFLAYHIAEPLTLVRNHNNNSSNSVNKDIWNQCWSLVQQKCQQRYNPQ